MNYIIWLQGLEPLITERKDVSQSEKSSGIEQIEFDQVRFAYPLRPNNRVLEDVSMDVSAAFCVLSQHVLTLLQVRKGQFIDTYRGEIITDAEASRREKGNNLKDSYLYSLDKFADTCGFSQEEMYVVDGQFYGNITRFINHSCEPNCRQYVVAYNRHDPKVYEIAFFATRDIAPDEELTFDYLDKDEGDEDDDDQVDPDDRKKGGMKPTRCRCGSEKCRKYLWL